MAELRAARARERSLLERFVEQALSAVAMFDHEMRYLAASRRWLRDFGLSQDVRGLAHYELFPEMTASWKDVHRRALAGEVLSAEEERFDRADGSVQWVTWEVRPWRLASGAIGGIVIASEDVSERVRARQALEAARREADAANQAKDEFMAMLGHELRNPLAPITTAIHLMRLRGDGRERELDVIERQVRHMVHLVDDLLDVSRIARGKVRLTRERIELSEIVGRAVELVSPMFEAARHALAVDVAPGGFAVDADATRMAQVVSNLLVNAAKYTPPGGHVRVSARRDGDGVVLRVADDGPGIPPELLPRVFDLFVQAKQGLDRSQGGLGLGLGIVRGLVELHGGRVSVESEPGRGSTFSVSLPLAASAAEEERAPGALVLAPAPCAEPIHVLVVDDNQDAADLLRSALEGLGYAARSAYDSSTALDLARSFEPDVALLDIGLPVMDGYELGRRLRASARAPALVVAVTGYGQESDRRRSEDAGFDAHLVKPIALEEVSSLLAEWAASRPPRC